MTFIGYGSTITVGNNTYPCTGITTMTQINYPFGDTLEFSCTVENGAITSQELVTSGSDAVVSFKLDKSNQLDPSELETIANRIRHAQTSGKVRRATDEEATLFNNLAKQFIADHPVLCDAGPGISFALAEMMAKREYITMYDAAITGEHVAPNVSTESDVDRASDFDDYDDEDDDDYWDDEDEYCDDDYDYEYR